MSLLTPEEVAHFQREGYLSYNKPVLPAAEFERLKGIFEEHLESGANLDIPHFRDERLLEFLLSDPILDLVEPLVGPDIGLWASGFISKPPMTGKPTPWHEDSAYWRGRIDTMEGICTVWLAIDPAFPANGSMGVIPGTHHDGGFSNYEFTGEVVDGIFDHEIVGVDDSRAVYFNLQPNECSLHEARIIHGSGPNVSDQRRTGYTMRYFPTTSHVIPEANPGFKIWLARGKDRAGNVFENA